MSSTTRIPKAEITGPYGYLLKRFSRKMLGEVPDGAAVMWQNRPVLMSLTGLGRKLQKWDQLDANLKSFANMAVAAQVGCSFCLDFGYFQAHNEGLDEVKASEVPRWRESTVFTPVEREVLEYAEAMTETPPRVTDELSARLLEQLGAPALVELTAVVGFANLTARGNTAMGDRIPGVLQGMRAATGATLGRPGSSEPRSPRVTTRADVADYAGRKTHNSLLSGLAMTTQSTWPWPMSTRVAPSASRRSTSACCSAWSSGATSRCSRFLPSFGGSGGPPQVINGPVPSGARIAVSSS
jgi:AhpD family alkylhydroperoxidase